MKLKINEINQLLVSLAAGESVHFSGGESEFDDVFEITVFDSSRLEHEGLAHHQKVNILHLTEDVDLENFKILQRNMETFHCLNVERGDWVIFTHLRRKMYPPFKHDTTPAMVLKDVRQILTFLKQYANFNYSASKI
jgi:hypothetical protein